MTKDEALQKLINLCRNNQCKMNDGGLVDCDTIWPSEILAIIDQIGGYIDASYL